MCLLTATTEPIELLEDLKVFKLFKIGTLTTVHRNFTYTRNQLFQTEMLLSRHGLPSDQLSEDALFLVDPEAYPNWSARVHELSKGCTHNFVGQGFHSYETETRAATTKSETNLYPQDELEIRTAIIPAGSLVYRDNTGLIVSNQIIIK